VNCHGWLPAVQAWSLRALAKTTAGMSHNLGVIVMIEECNIVASFGASHVQRLWEMAFDANQSVAIVLVLNLPQFLS
jgi:hypothetical protein